MVENLFQIVTKSDVLAPHRYSLVLLKVGCPINCSEWLPVSRSFFEECLEGEIIQLNIKRVPMSVDQAHKFVAQKRPVMPTFKFDVVCTPGQGCGIEEYDPQQV